MALKVISKVNQIVTFLARISMFKSALEKLAGALSGLLASPKILKNKR